MHVRVCVYPHAGMFRNRKSSMPIQYYNRLPKDRCADITIVLDPLIATCACVPRPRDLCHLLCSTPCSRPTHVPSTRPLLISITTARLPIRPMSTQPVRHHARRVIRPPTSAGTINATISTLKKWGTKRLVVVGVIGSTLGT
jgi:hypothetical protein